MSEKKYVIYFGGNKDTFQKTSESFPECSPMQLSDMKATFNFLQSEFVDAVVFETFQDEANVGINQTDLDVLLFFATSESSKNRMAKFYPIDQESDTHGLKAVQLYENLYEKYLFLMEGQKLSQFSSEVVKLPQGLDLLADLVGTLDEACDDLDEALQPDSTKVSFNSDTEVQIVQGGTSLDNDGNEVVSGGVEDFGEEDKLVKGTKRDLAEEAIKIEGSLEEDESSVTVKGYGEDTDGNQLVAGEREDLTEDSTLIGGEKEDLTEENTLISGDREDLSEDSTMIGGQREDLKEEAITIKGSHENESSEDGYTVSAEPQEDQKQKTVVKGSKSNIKTEFMTVKKLDSATENSQDEEEQAHSINDRNKLGQTPIMVLSRAGDFERAEELIHKGADVTLNCKEGKSVLHYACQNSNNFNLVKFLVEQQGCKINKRDSAGRDPLFEATMSDSPEIVRFLLDQGARINTKIEGNTYLHIAAEKNKIQSFKVLLTFGANTQSTNDRGQTVAQYCKSKKKLAFLKVMEAVKRLKEKRAS